MAAPEGGGRRRRSRRHRNRLNENGAPSQADVFAQPEFPQPVGPPQLSAEQLGEMSKAELNELAKTFDIATPVKIKKDELVAQILESQAQRSGVEQANGVLDILPEGYGFLRREGYLLGADDIYISQSQIRRFELRRGDLVAGQVRRPKDNEKYYGIVKVETVNGYDPESIRTRRSFDDLNAMVPASRWKLAVKGDAAARALDLVRAARQRPARADHGAAARRRDVDAGHDRAGHPRQRARHAPDRALDRRPSRRRRGAAAPHRLPRSSRRPSTNIPTITSPPPNSCWNARSAWSSSAPTS